MTLHHVLLAVFCAACWHAPGCSAPFSPKDPVADGVAEDTVDGVGLTCDPTLPQLDTLDVTVDGNRILDSRGRELIFRGVNAGGRSKLPPFLPFAFAESGDVLQGDAPPFAEAVSAYVDRVADWGHNVVRVPFTWDALEPTKGEYDAVFLERYAAMAAAFGSRGIRVIVDFHQDVFARTFCGDGFPLWAVQEGVEPMEFPCHDWFTGYLMDGPVRDAYDRFWNNEDDLQGAFQDMWRHMVQGTQGVDGVIGYEIINEPDGGSLERTEFLKTVLTPFYSTLIAVIREEAPGIPVFFDATGLDGIEAATELDRPEGEGLVFAPHYYDPPAILQGVWSGTSDYSEPLGKWRAQGDEWDVPVLIGEFGLKREATGVDQYARLHFDAMDTHLLHGTLWEYSATVDDWNEEGMSILAPDGSESAVVSAVIRAFPAAVSGRIVTFAYDADTRVGSLVLEASPADVSEIVAPGRLYPEGVEVTLSGVEACAQVDSERGRIGVRAMEPGRLNVGFGPASRE